MLLLFCSGSVIGQILANPSFEGPPRESIPPPDWFPCNTYSTPDTQPGFWNVNSPPSQGNTYISLTTRGINGLDNDNTVEAIAAVLQNLEPNQCYQLSLDLAFSSEFSFNGIFYQPVKLTVWLSSTSCGREQLIWTSPTIDHTDWRSYELNFSRTADYRFLILEAAFDQPNPYPGNVLIDNIRTEKNSVNVQGNNEVCEGDTIELSVEGNWDIINWSNGAKEFNIEVTSPGTYSAEVRQGNCVLEDAITIENIPPIDVELGSDVQLCGEDHLVLDVSVPNAVYLWNDGSRDPVKTITEAGLYHVAVENDCQVVSDSIEVSFRTECCEIFAPDVFTPNGDQRNDFFEVSTQSNIVQYDLEIFNRWGRLVFRSGTLDHYWDGRLANGQNASTGVYYWTARIACIESNSILDSQYKGTITLLK